MKIANCGAHISRLKRFHFSCGIASSYKRYYSSNKLILTQKWDIRIGSQLNWHLYKLKIKMLFLLNVTL